VKRPQNNNTSLGEQADETRALEALSNTTVADALGLGAVWLSERKAPESTGQRFKEQYGLPDYIEVALHITVGWPAIGTIKSKRVPLTDMMIRRHV